jgi:hypothetical protein
MSMQAWQQFIGGVLFVAIAAILFRAAGLKDVEFGSVADWFSGVATAAAVVIALHQVFEAQRARLREDRRQAAARIETLDHIIQVCSAAHQIAETALRMIGGQARFRHQAHDMFVRRFEPQRLRWGLVEVKDLHPSERNMVSELAAVLGQLPADVDRIAKSTAEELDERDRFPIISAIDALQFFERVCRDKVARDRPRSTVQNQ